VQGEHRTCKKCGHRCHCYARTCEDCVNDICTGCDCEPTDTMIDTDARTWPFMDSGIDRLD